MLPIVIMHPGNNKDIRAADYFNLLDVASSNC